MIGETLRLWLKQADLNEGQRSDGLTSDEQEVDCYNIACRLTKVSPPNRGDISSEVFNNSGQHG